MARQTVFLRRKLARTLRAIFRKQPPRASAVGSAPARARSGPSGLSFYDLPAELRIRVYELVLTRTGHVCLCTEQYRAHGSGCYCRFAYPLTTLPDHPICQVADRCFRKHLTSCHAALPVGLLLTSRQVASEALEVLVTSNTFIFDYMLGCKRPLAGILPALEGIRHAFFVFFPFADAVAWDALPTVSEISGAIEQIRSLRSLQTARFAIIHGTRRLKKWRDDEGLAVDRWNSALFDLLLWELPATCSLGFGSRSGEEKEFIQARIYSAEMDKELKKDLVKAPPVNILGSREVGCEALERVAKEMMARHATRRSIGLRDLITAQD